MKQNLKTAILSFLVVGGVAAAAACSGDLSLEDRPCPCTYGYICCDGYCEQSGCSGKHDTSTADDDDDDDTSSSTTTTTTVSPEIHVLATTEDPLCITADPTALFWMNADGTIAGGSTVAPQVVRSRMNPSPTVGACNILRSGDGLYVAARDAGGIFWLSVSYAGATPSIGETLRTVATVASPSGLVQDDASLYVLAGATGEVHRIPKLLGDGGGPAPGGAGVVIGTGAAHAYELLLDDGLLYWFDSVGLRRMPAAGGTIATVATLAPTTKTQARDLRAASGGLYWIEDGEIMTVPIAGGVAHALPVTSFSGSDAQFVSGLAVSGEGLVVSHYATMNLLGFTGGKEVQVFRYSAGSDLSTTRDASTIGVSELLFDTMRYVWVKADKTIAFRPVVENDPTLPKAP